MSRGNLLFVLCQGHEMVLFFLNCRFERHKMHRLVSKGSMGDENRRGTGMGSPF